MQCGTGVARPASDRPERPLLAYGALKFAGGCNMDTAWGLSCLHPIHASSMRSHL